MRRVVIVGNEVRVREGLVKSLQPFGDAWAVEQSTFEELPSRLAQTADAVILDARDPEVASAALDACRRKAPSTVRAVLCGAEVSAGAAVRLLERSHQLLKRPVVTAQVFELVERLCVVVETLAAPRLKQVLGQFGSLPALPTTYAKLTDLTANPDTSLESVAAVVEVDAGVTAKVLRVVNSAFFGLPRQVTSVREAVKYLGIAQVKYIVLSVEVFGSGGSADKLVKELQTQALARASAMRELLGRTPMAEQAFAAGILSEVGRLLIATRLPVDAMAIAKEVAAGADLVDAERKRLGATHAEIGGALLSMWNLPIALVEAVMLHHHPPQLTATPNVSTALAFVTAIEQAVQVAEAAARQSERLIVRLSESFPSADVAVVRRHLAMRDAA